MSWKIVNNTDNVDVDAKCIGLSPRRDTIPQDVWDHIATNRGLHIQIKHNKDPQAFAQANELARLIAAAPELLESIKQFVGRRRRNLEDYCYVSEDIEALILGCDPEFGLVIPASGRLQYAQYTNVLSKTAQLGHDGPLAEVRPPPANCVAKLLENIGNILKTKSEKIASYNWIGGATYTGPSKEDNRTYHIGGHIHIGNPALLDQKLRVAAHQRLTQLLDETIALPLVRIDTPNPYLRRNTAWHGYGRYGRYGDSKGKPGRMEWRVPSGLWLVHPELARAVLGTTKAVSESFYQMLADKKFDQSWLSAYPDKDGLLKAWGALPKETVEKIINKAEACDVTGTLLNRTKSKLRDLPNYEQYKDEIESFISFISLSKKDRNNLNLDLKSGWLNKGSLIKG